MIIMNYVSEHFNSVSTFIEQAEETGVVDMGIISPLENLSSAFLEIGDYWLESKKGEKLEDVFAPYHTARNCGLVIRRMIQRFKASQTAGDNPRVADDASQVLPILIDTYRVLEEAKSGLMNEFRVKGFDRARHLRNIARMVDMLPSEDEDLATIPQETRKRGYDVFSKVIAGAVHDDEGSS